MSAPRIDPLRRALLAAGAGLAAGACRARRPAVRAAPTAVAPESPWPAILAAMPPNLAACVADPACEVQLLLTEVHRAQGRIGFVEHPWRLAPERWFAAASLVKLVLVLLAAERLSALGLDGRARIALAAPPASGEWSDAEPEAETFARTAARLLVVSENAPFNRLYDWLGPDHIATRLAAFGWPQARIHNRIGSLDADANRRVAGSRVLDPTGAVRELRPARVLPVSTPFPHGPVRRGRGWYDGATYVEGPRDFSRANALPLPLVHRLLAGLLYGDDAPAAPALRLSPALRALVIDCASRWPRENDDPVYPESEYPDAHAKWLVVGDRRGRAPPGLRLTGKSGMAWGWLSDCERIVDAGRGVACVLSAVIHVNADGVYDDAAYDYETVGLPFLGALGRAAIEVPARGG